MDERPEGPRRDADEERAVGVPPHQPPLDHDRDDERLDELSEESFPGSDPPATGGPGI